MLVVLASPGVVTAAAGTENEVAAALGAIVKAGHLVGIISNSGKPDWFDSRFAGTNVEFRQEQGRQSGAFVKAVAQHVKLHNHDVLVLASTLEDMEMGKNGGAVLVAAGWSPEEKVRALGIGVKSLDELLQTVTLTDAWPGQWWFAGDEPWYSVKSLSDLSTLHKDITQVDFGDRIKATVKQGGPRLMALLTISARSLLKEGIANERNLAFGVYPSSRSSNNDTEVLSDFCHRLRTTVSRVRFAERNEPLFIRHTASSKRSQGGGGDRTNPSEQIETLHLNPRYKGKLAGRHVLVVDDCTTYGVSFGVAAALLRAGGAKKVTGVALGKFGQQLRYYEIEVKSDPFAPIPHGSYQVNVNRKCNGTSSIAAQSTLVSLV